MTSIRAIATTLIAAFALSGAARAQETPDPSATWFYYGASQLVTHYQLKGSRQFVFGSYTGNVIHRDSHLGWKMFGGFQFTPKWGAEFSYVDLGRTAFRGTATTATGAAVPFRFDVEPTAVTLAATHRLQLNDRYSLVGKAGGYSWDTEYSDVIRGGFRGDSGVNLFAGLGVNYQLSPNIVLRAESEHFFGPDKNITVSAGASFRF